MPKGVIFRYDEKGSIIGAFTREREMTLEEFINRKPMTYAEKSRLFRKRHPDQARKTKEKNRELKKRILTYYGKNKLACVRCGFNDIRALSIDHINGRGTKHRKDLFGGFYHWLEKNNYPDGYQTLCMNCQFIKRFEKGEHSLKGRK